MRKTLRSTLILALSAFTTAICSAEEDEKEDTTKVKFEHAVVVGNSLIGVDNRGHLICNDLLWGTSRDYGTLGRKLGRFIDVARDKACVVTQEEICEVDLASGKIVRSAKQTTGIGGVGFIDASRVFIHNGHSMEIIDLAADKTLHRIDLATDKRNRQWLMGKPLIAHSRGEDLLYVARPFHSDVAVVDLNRGKLVQEIEAADFGWTTGVHVAGNKLFTRQMMVSYGILREQLFVVDLKAEKSRRLQFPNPPSDREPRHVQSGSTTANMEIIPNDDGGFFIAAHERVYQYNANGLLAGKSPLAIQGGKRLIAAFHGLALLVDADSVSRIELSPVKIVAN